MATKLEYNYYKRLEPKTKLRYKEKIDLISNCDPYTIKKDEMMREIENFPSIILYCQLFPVCTESPHQGRIEGI